MTKNVQYVSQQIWIPAVFCFVIKSNNIYKHVLSISLGALANQVQQAHLMTQGPETTEKNNNKPTLGDMCPSPTEISF